MRWNGAAFALAVAIAIWAGVDRAAANREPLRDAEFESRADFHRRLEDFASSGMQCYEYPSKGVCGKGGYPSTAGVWRAPKHPVIVVPGIIGSVIIAKNTTNANLTQVWLSVRNGDMENPCDTCSSVPANYCTLTTDPDHCYDVRFMSSRYNASSDLVDSVNPVVTAFPWTKGGGLCGVDNLDKALVWPVKGEADYFYNLFQFLSCQLGYVQEKTLWAYPYDWRLAPDSDELAGGLLRLIERVYIASGNRTVDIYSHSMGGLVTSSLMSRFPKEAAKYVRSWLSVATPFQGAGLATNAFIQGYNFGLKQIISDYVAAGINNKTAHHLGMEWPSGYCLLPSALYKWKDPPLLTVRNNSLAWIDLAPWESQFSTVLKEINRNNSFAYTFDRMKIQWNNTFSLYPRAVQFWETMYQLANHMPRAIDTAATSLTPSSHSGNLSIPLRVVSSASSLGVPKSVLSDLRIGFVAGRGVATPHSFVFPDIVGPLEYLMGRGPSRVTTVSGDGTVPLESSVTPPFPRNFNPVFEITGAMHFGVHVNPITMNIFRRIAKLSCQWYGNWTMTTKSQNTTLEFPQCYFGEFINGSNDASAGILTNAAPFFLTISPDCMQLTGVIGVKSVTLNRVVGSACKPGDKNDDDECVFGAWSPECEAPWPPGPLVGQTKPKITSYTTQQPSRRFRLHKTASP